MGLPVEVNNLMLGSLGGYTVGRSLRFRSSASAYLNRTPASTTNQKTWTWSGWVKRGALGGEQYFFGAGSGSPRFIMGFTSDAFFINPTGGVTAATIVSTAVYRDPSAWYHFVIAVDTTQTTAANRVKIYVNNVQITSFSSSTYPNQNDTWLVNSNVIHTIGSAASLSQYLDGYQAEVNFIDGQQLTPSSFGAYDTNGVWQPKKYSGTYGTNGFYLPFSQNITSTYAANVNSGYLSAASNSAFAVGAGAYTFETWFYPTSTSQGQLYFSSANGLQVGYFSSSSWGIAQANIAWELTTSTMPVQNAWNHLVAVRSGTGTNQTALFLNGVRVAVGTVATNYAQTAVTLGQSIVGSLSNLRLIKGSAIYDPSQTTITVPTSPLTNVTNTSLLTFQNSSAIDNSSNAISLTTNGTVTYSVQYPFTLNISADQSGNGNNWTPNNISLINGTTYDSMIDSPTNAAGTSTGIGNYAVLNPLSPSVGSQLSNGNLTSSNGGLNVFSTIQLPTSGKWYAEFNPSAVWNTGAYLVYGAMAVANASGTYSGLLATTNASNGGIYQNGSFNQAFTTWATSDVIGIAVDIGANTVQVYRNGSTLGTAVTLPSGDLWFYVSSYSGGNVINANFGQRPFSYTPPSGFKALNTYNLPTPSIANGAQYMTAITYSGNSTNGRAVTTGFRPDFVWVKNRSSAFDNILGNSMILTGGEPTLLSSNLTLAEFANGYIGNTSQWTSTSFTVNGDSRTNATGSNYVAWAWLGGNTNGSGVTNTSGTITSTVSASPSSGFSIATYTGTGANATVGHGLGVAPSMYIVKCRSNAGTQWPTYHVSMGATKAMNLDATSGAITYNLFWNNTAPTSSVFSIGSVGADTNINGATFVAYCFAAVSGYSAFGSYTGNGSSDGPFIYTGFRPKWIMIKNSSYAGTGWRIFDTSRSSYNATTERLWAHSNAAESTASAIDILSNGFKIRDASLSDWFDYNKSGDTMIYMAFAENPFNLSRAR